MKGFFSQVPHINADVDSKSALYRQERQGGEKNKINFDPEVPTVCKCNFTEHERLKK